MKRRFPLSRKRPRIIPPRRQHHQSPVLVSVEIREDIAGCYHMDDVTRLLESLGFEPRLISGLPWYSLGDLQELVRRHRIAAGFPDDSLWFYLKPLSGNLTCALTRPVTRPARISPKLAAFFGWDTPSTK